MTSDAPSWDQLRDEAADWLAAMDTGERSREDFEAWRDADPRHAAAFVQVASSLVTLDRIKPDLKARVAPVRVTSRRTLIFGGVAAVAVAAGAGGLAVATAKSTITTGVGQQKSVSLTSGGTLLVNTSSRVQYRAKEEVTEVWLREGELALDLSHTDRPCRLYAADRIADVSNGVFNARLRGSLLDLAVVSGRCTLNPDRPKGDDPAKGPKTTIVEARHAVLSGGNEAVVRPLNDVDTAFLTAWPKGELVFEGQTLETAVAEYNRYLPNKIVIADASLSGIRLGGRFTTRDPEIFLNSLRKGFGIRATGDGEGNIALTK